MTARDERLEAAVKALREQGYDGPTAYRYAAAGIIVGDAVRAFDERQQRQFERGTVNFPIKGTFEAKTELDPAASPVGADPPWLDEADLREIFARELDRNREPFLASAMRGGHDNSNGGTAAIAAMKEAIRFAASQPPSAEEIEAAGKEIVARLHLGKLSLDTEQRIASAALLAAARVRAGG